MVSWPSVSPPEPATDDALQSPHTSGLHPRLQFGKYQLHRRLARGGMGEVYLARLVGELGFEKQLVIKTILPELAEKPRFIELFAAEAKTAVALSHGNIVPTYELGRAADTFYIAMGYVDGPSLAQLLDAEAASGAGPNIPAAMHVIRGVLAGLAYAHLEAPGRPAVVHRDITPRNVLIDRSGQVRIVDFGIAAPAQRQVGVRAGSTGYVSPEQARGDVADPRADVFSVGCLLYELCTHTRAFPKEAVWVMPELSAVPDALREPLRHAMAIDPDARPTDAAAMASELRPAFAALAGHFDDAALAGYLRERFPDGWSNEVPADSEDGEAQPLQAPSETYATRLTAITGLDPSAGLDSSGPSGDDMAASDSSVVAATPANLRTSSTTAPRSARVSASLLIVGALGIGVAAFSVGRCPSVETTQPAVGQPRLVDAEAPPSDPEIRARAPEGRDPPRDASDPASALASGSDVAPTPPSTGSAELRRHALDVRPAAAAVTVDGTRLPGTAPFELTLPTDGRVRVVISHRGYRTQTLTLSSKDTELPTSIKLEPETPRDPGQIQVSAPSVPWAEVRVDGKKVGNTPTRKLPVSSGRHRVEVRCIPDACPSERVLYRKLVTIEPGKTTRIEAGR